LRIRKQKTRRLSYRAGLNLGAQGGSGGPVSDAVFVIFEELSRIAMNHDFVYEIPAFD
jgi:hypothetical protein